jgi:hypothetical protein
MHPDFQTRRLNFEETDRYVHCEMETSRANHVIIIIEMVQVMIMGAGVERGQPKHLPTPHTFFLGNKSMLKEGK